MLNREKKLKDKAATHAHIVLGILVGTGIDQQPHTVRVTTPSGPIQRRQSTLRLRFVATHSTTAIETQKTLIRLKMQAYCTQESQADAEHIELTTKKYPIFVFDIGALGQERDNIVRATIICGSTKLVALNGTNI